MTTNPQLNEILATTQRVTCEVCEGEDEPERRICRFNPQDDDMMVINPDSSIILSRKDLEAPQWGNSRTFYHSPTLTFTFWG